jgi:hypothetical protein
MRFLRCIVFAFFVLLAGSHHSSRAQALVDTTMTWDGYAQTARCEVRIYPTPDDEERTRVVMLREVAQNDGPTTVADLSYLAEEVGRHFDIDPANAYWVVHWGGFSYKDVRRDEDKELFLRATFGRTDSQRLSSPRWDVASRTEVREYTDRRFD